MDNLTSLYAQRLNLQNATFSRIEHDDAIVAIVYKVTQPSGVPLILKICTRAQEYLRELYFLNHFAGKLPVPNIIQVVPPEANVYEAILMEYLQGAPLKIADITDELAYEIGTLLARIHLNRAVGYGDLTRPDDLTLSPREYFTQQFESGFAECSKHLPAALLKKCRDYFNTHINLLDSVDGPCMVHRDFRPGNLMVSDGRLQGIIDWATSRASAAQEDFATLEHCWEWPINSTYKESFLAGYVNIRPVPDYSVVPLLRLSRALDVIGFTLKRGTWESSNASLYQFNRRFLDVFFAKS